MASTKTVLRLAGKRPLGTAAQLSRGAQRASLSHSSKRCAEKDDTAQRLREAAPDLLSELRKAPRRRESPLLENPHDQGLTVV